MLSYSFISTSIYNSVHHTCEYNQLQNRSNHFDTPGVIRLLISRDIERADSDDIFRNIEVAVPDDVSRGKRVAVSQVARYISKYRNAIPDYTFRDNFFVGYNDISRVIEVT